MGEKDLLKGLEERARIKAQKAPTVAFGSVHPKQRKARNIKIAQIVEQATVPDILRWLDEDEKEGHIGACLIMGRLASWKMEGRVLSKDHEAILKLIKVLYETSKLVLSTEK